MKQPFFSIIIPTLNEEKYLPHLLSDLSKQTFQDFEVIIVDAISEDKTVSCAKSFKSILPSLKIITSPKRHVCTQRNLGAKQAFANVLVFSDADNRLSPSFLLGLKYRWETSSADIMSCWLEPDIKNQTNKTIAFSINYFFELQNNLKPTYLLEALIVTSQTCFKAVGGFDESVFYAEGKTFIQSAINKGYTAKIVRDPVYTFSFRRLRKYGTLGIAGRIAKMQLVELIGQDKYHITQRDLYPMKGGKFFDKPEKLDIHLLLQKLTSKSDRQRYLKKIQAFIEKNLS